MGKASKRKDSKYEHVHTHNPKARESNERKLSNVQGITVKRFQGYVHKLRETLRSYVPPEFLLKPKMDPRYQLKGGALAAQEYYLPPGYSHTPEPINLLETLSESGSMWSQTEGRDLLKALLDLGIALHNVAGKSKEAGVVFLEALRMDPADHLLVRHRLLRLHLDRADGLAARGVLDEMQHWGRGEKQGRRGVVGQGVGVGGSEVKGETGAEAPSSSSSSSTSTTATATITVTGTAAQPDVKTEHTAKKGKEEKVGKGSKGTKQGGGGSGGSGGGADLSSCSTYNMAFLEHVSLLLEESGSSEERREEMLHAAFRANPHTLWVITHHHIFAQVVTRAQLLNDPEIAPTLLRGSVEDALSFYDADLPLWVQTEGAVEFVRQFADKQRLSAPTLLAQLKKGELGNNGLGNWDATGLLGEGRVPGVMGGGGGGGGSGSGGGSGVVSGGGGDGAETSAELHDMYVGMMQTALELVE